MICPGGVIHIILERPLTLRRMAGGPGETALLSLDGAKIVDAIPFCLAVPHFLGIDVCLTGDRVSERTEAEWRVNPAATIASSCTESGSPHQHAVRSPHVDPVLVRIGVAGVDVVRGRIGLVDSACP